MPLILSHDKGQLVLPDDTLVFALDDTGHEQFRDARYNVFGLGGCAFLVSDYQRLLERPWEFMLRRFFPNLERPVHACESFRKPTPDQLSALTHFFTRFEFFRLAVTVSSRAAKNVAEGYIELVTAAVLQRISEVAAHAQFSRIFLLIEGSERTEMEIVRGLSGRRLRREGHEYELEFGVMPKSACMPALEVADVIAHTAGGQTKWRNGQDGRPVRRDFVDIFQTVDRRLVSFMEITSVEYPGA